MYRRKKSSWVKHLDFTIIDLLMMELAIFVAYALRFDGSILFLSNTGDNPEMYQEMAVFMIFVNLVVVFISDAYSGILRRTRYQELRSTIFHVLLNFLGTLLYMYGMRISFETSRLFMGFFGVGMVLFMYAGRVILKIIIRKRVLSDRAKSAMLLIVEKERADDFLKDLAHNKYNTFRVNGVVVMDDDLTGKTIQGVPVVASADTLFEYVRTNVVDEVFIDSEGTGSLSDIAGQLVELGATVHIGLLRTNQLMPNRIMETYGNYMVLTTSMHIATNRQVVAKRIIDIIGAIVGLLFCGIAFLIFAIPIRIQSKASVFFSQTRMGLNGRRFKFYKFRTMYADAEKRKKELLEKNEMDNNLVFKMKDDPRIIPIGKFLRKYSVDELPQFWNVLKGDMSLVGTRPPTEDEFENYALHHKARLGIKPGLTGMWQVSGRSDITDFEEIVSLDTEYISNWSLGLDIMILFKTIKVVFTGKGSH